MKNEAQIFKALGDENRLRILALLLDGELCVCELMAALDLPQSTVSRHLSYLKNSGWLDDRREGVWIYYRLRSEATPLITGLMPVLKECLASQPIQVEASGRLDRFRQDQKSQVCNA